MNVSELIRSPPVKLPVSSASLVFFAVLYLGKQADVPPWASGPDSMQPVASPLK